MTRAEFLERLDASQYAILPNGAIRTKTPACACPIEAESGLGAGKVYQGAELLGIDNFDRETIMDAADYSLAKLKGAARRFRQQLIQKLRMAHGGKLPRKPAGGPHVESQ